MLDQFACLPALQQWACHALHAHAGSSQHTAMQPGACISPPVCIHATSFPLHLSCCCCILQEGWCLSQGSQELQLQELQVLEAVSSPSTNDIQTTWLLHVHVLVTTAACSCALPLACTCHHHHRHKRKSIPPAPLPRTLHPSTVADGLRGHASAHVSYCCYQPGRQPSHSPACSTTLPPPHPAHTHTHTTSHSLRAGVCVAAATVSALPVGATVTTATA